MKQRCLSVEIWFKMKVEPMFVYWHCFNFGKTALKQLCQYLLYWYSLESGSNVKHIFLLYKNIIIIVSTVIKRSYWIEFTWNINKLCVNYCIRIGQNILYTSQIPNFNGEHSDMSICKTLEKSWILKILRKESIFLYSIQRDTTYIFFDL